MSAYATDFLSLRCTWHDETRVARLSESAERYGKDNQLSKNLGVNGGPAQLGKTLTERGLPSGLRNFPSCADIESRLVLL
jgi:hypothetical protein